MHAHGLAGAKSVANAEPGRARTKCGGFAFRQVGLAMKTYPKVLRECQVKVVTEAVEQPAAQRRGEVPGILERRELFAGRRAQVGESRESDAAFEHRTKAATLPAGAKRCHDGPQVHFRSTTGAAALRCAERLYALIDRQQARRAIRERDADGYTIILHSALDNGAHLPEWIGPKLPPRVAQAIGNAADLKRHHTTRQPPRTLTPWLNARQLRE